MVSHKHALNQYKKSVKTVWNSDAGKISYYFRIFYI